MAGTRPLERLTASDLFLLLWDDYGWSTDIGGLAILDGTSLLDDEGRVRVDAVRRHLPVTWSMPLASRHGPAERLWPGYPAIPTTRTLRPARRRDGRRVRG